LTLAADCLDEALQLDAAVRQQVETVLIANLESDDPELFKLAAEVKLQRRLRNLQRIDDDREIDRTFISCAEYQLFLDEMRTEYRFYQLVYQPDHWTKFRFPKGSALQPIAGVRAQDAGKFCEWLSEKENKKYRCPTLTEAQEFSAVENQEFTTWCGSWKEWDLQWSTSRTKWEIESKLEKLLNNYIIKQDSHENLTTTLSLDRTRVFAHAHAGSRAFTRSLAFAIDIILNSELAHALARALADSLDEPILQEGLEKRNFIVVQQYLCKLQPTSDITERKKNLLIELLDILTTGDYFEQQHAWRRYLAYLAEYAVIGYRMLEKERDKKRSWWQQLFGRKVESYTEEKEKMIALYAWTKIIEARQKGELPAWEGIRIVRESDV